MDVNFDSAKATKYLKTYYGKPGVTISHSYSPTQAMLAKDYKWKGGSFEEAVSISMGFGMGGGDYIPDAAVEKVIKPTMNEVNQFVSVRINNKLIARAVGNESSFVHAQASRWERGQKAFAWNRERQLFNDGSGSLGTVSALTTNSDPSFVLTISNATWKQFNWEIGCLVNLVRASVALTDVFELTAVDVANKRVTIQRQVGSSVPAASDVIVMQNSYNADIMGFKTITDAALGSTLYGETVQYKYQSHQQLSIGATIDEELIDNAFIDTSLLAGEAPDYIVTSPKQWKILKSANIGLKRYMVENPSVAKNLRVRLGFQALEYTAPQGSATKPIPIAYSQFCEDDRMYLINTSRATLMYIGEPHWFDADGTAFARTPDKKNDMEARWEAYGNLYMLPTFHGVMTGLA